MAIIRVGRAFKIGGNHTPKFGVPPSFPLEEHLKLGVITPLQTIVKHCRMLEEHLKLGVITPKGNLPEDGIGWKSI